MKIHSLIATFLVSTCLATISEAQSRRRASTPQPTPATIDSVQWRKDHYVVNRDSAYADPRIALRKLMGGNRRFVEHKSIRPRQDQAALTSTEKGQKPFAIVVSCADSRVPNEIIFDQGVGDLFIIRTAGQVMAEASYGSIEYASVVLGSKLIVVLGHQSCGAVDAAVKRPENLPGHIIALVNSIKPAAQKAKAMGGNLLENAIRQNVIEQVNSLRDLDPVLSRKYQNGEILIVGAVYNLGTGKVEFLPETLPSMVGYTTSGR
ncbi:carbonic anhydrase [Rudanella paleaurantiibacter]|uniref:carbonic anhydrase n=1 Tax=Rudanella paleaurantiibacter TaxID=2614655 RepID=UPI001FEAF58A|nr:carbonic anhydrase [Rudanella paleaurantiibacter]